MSDTTQKLSVGEKLGYSCGDAAANFVFMTMVLFQSNFYTDVFGLAAATAGGGLAAADEEEFAARELPDFIGAADADRASKSSISFVRGMSTLAVPKIAEVVASTSFAESRTWSENAVRLPFTQASIADACGVPLDCARSMTVKPFA